MFGKWSQVPSHTGATMDLNKLRELERQVTDGLYPDDEEDRYRFDTVHSLMGVAADEGIALTDAIGMLSRFDDYEYADRTGHGTRPSICHLEVLFMHQQRNCEHYSFERIMERYIPVKYQRPAVEAFLRAQPPFSIDYAELEVENDTATIDERAADLVVAIGACTPQPGMVAIFMNEMFDEMGVVLDYPYMVYRMTHPDEPVVSGLDARMGAMSLDPLS
jgi:hypothetical protein